MKRNYSIGLDIGISSVGWACITPDFRIPKFNGRYAIGVREFESADTAEARRIQRGTRRRYNRRIKRIQLLQQTLSPIFNNNPDFFMKTDAKEQHFWRNNNQFEHNSLSEVLKDIGEDTKKYPTIYHLRNSILKDDVRFDPRLIYLALHNLVKYRGHFLNEHMQWIDTTDNDSTTEDLLRKYFLKLEEVGYSNNQSSTKVLNQIVYTLESTEITNADKRNSIKKLIGKEYHEPISLIIGLKSDMCKIFPNSDRSDLYKEEKLKVSFSDEDITEVYEMLSDEEKTIIDEANKIYQHVLLNGLLDGANSVAEAKVESYTQFGKDLNLLKEIYNEYLGEKAYRDMFITTRKNQTKYKNTRKSNLLCTFDRFLKIHSSEDSFYKELKKVFEKLLKELTELDKDSTTIQDTLSKISKNKFLQKQKGHLNAAIPHQNNVYEAETILRNQQKYYPAITDEMIEKITQIISFRIPYYIGPLVKGNYEHEFGWAIRKDDNAPVLPWTIDQVIDRSKSAEQFINRMTSYCAYLTKEKVLPKHSMTYELFEVLNELNGIQIRPGYELPNKKYRLSKEEKEWILENVFKKYKNVTHTILLRELKKSKYKDIVLDSQTDSVNKIFGTQKEDRFGTSLSTHITMKNIFNDMREQDLSMLEELIYWITVFEDKEIIKMKIKEKYKTITENQINILSNLPLAGWGRLSNRLINELPADMKDNLTILELMKRDTVVFMEVLGTEKYQLNERITKLNLEDNKSFTKIKYKDIAELQGSPALKKGIWQSILVIEDLVNIFGEPEHIMIEFARDEGRKERTVNRKKWFLDIHKAVSKDETELKSFLKEHSRYDEKEYNDPRLYLYISQEGKCLYSGELLNIRRLQDYEVDHILPRNFVKDDSIDNLALVTSKMNQSKGGIKMPLEILSNSEQAKQKAQWTKLYNYKLISQSKYFKLMKESFSDQDKESFFARQLVETRQITKHVKDLLNVRFEQTEIHPINANIVTNLRKHSNIVKLRDMNNKHHAVDAALSAVIVQFIINKYGHNFLNFNFKYQEAQKKWREMLTKYKKNFFLFSDIDQHDKFSHFKTGELLSGREFLNMLNNEIPWQTTKKIGSSEAAFYKETLFSPRVKNPKYTSPKTSKGVYDEMKTDSTYLISYKELNKSNKQITKNEFVDLYVIEKYQLKQSTNKEFALFLANKVAKGKVIDAVIHTKINKFQLVSYKDHKFYYISSNEMHNAQQLLLNENILQSLFLTHRESLKNIDLSELKTLFSDIADAVAINYKEFLPESRVKTLKKYSDKIIDEHTFLHGLTELFKTTSASAARSQLFGHRYQKKINPNDLKFLHQSVTGLQYRKPKSYKNELWSQ